MAICTQERLTYDLIPSLSLRTRSETQPDRVSVVRCRQALCNHHKHRHRPALIAEEAASQISWLLVIVGPTRCGGLVVVSSVPWR